MNMYLAPVVKPRPKPEAKPKFCHACNGSRVVTIKTMCSRCQGTGFVYSDNIKIPFRQFYRCPMTNCNNGYVYTKVPCPHPH